MEKKCIVLKYNQKTGTEALSISLSYTKVIVSVNVMKILIPPAMLGRME